MRKAKESSPVVTVVVKPVRFCQREGCENPLARNRKKFCSHVCRNLFISGGNGGGGPSMYKPEFSTTKLTEYIDMIEEANKPTLLPTKGGFIVLQNARLPLVEDFALFLGHPTATLKRWQNEHLDFANAVDMLVERQKMMLMNNGLSGRYSPVISKLMLSANHGVIERKEVDHRHAMVGIVKHVYARADELTPGHHEESNQPDSRTD